jgi:hypothetical protein
MENFSPGRGKPELFSLSPQLWAYIASMGIHSFIVVYVRLHLSCIRPTRILEPETTAPRPAAMRD